MSRTVFILGAGASADAGAPLMGDFFDRAERLIPRAGKYQEAFETVFRGRAELQRVHSKARLDLDNLETVFAAIEMASLQEQLAGLSQRDLLRLPSAIRLMIARTLELTVRWPAQAAIESPGAYGVFAQLIQRFRKEKGPDSVSVITFNYDVAADYALEKALEGERVELDYGLGPREDRQKDVQYLDLLKLHGSLNWNECSSGRRDPSIGDCGAVYTWRIREFLKKRPFPRRAVDPVTGRAEPETLRLELLEAMSGQACPRCGSPSKPQPMIVPPTWSKTQYYERIRPVWRRAAQHLHEAENIVIVGYSVTPADESFRYLYALGTIGPTTIRRFWVFDWSGATDTYRSALEARYRALLGISTEKRLRIAFESFGWAVDEVGRHLAAF
jgi:hypothetical protein